MNKTHLTVLVILCASVVNGFVASSSGCEQYPNGTDKIYHWFNCGAGVTHFKVDLTILQNTRYK
jgi:hypothetical protein